jgi:hypothetical protein
VQPPLAGHTALAGAESAGGGIETRDRGRGPSRYRGRGRGRDRGQGTEIITGDSRGRAQGQSPLSGDVGVDGQTRGHCPTLVLVLGPALGHARDRGRGRATGEAVIRSAHVGLAPEVGPRVVATAAAGNASDEGREVVRRMCVFGLQYFACRFILSGLASAEGEEREEEKWDGDSRSGQPVGQIWRH